MNFCRACRRGYRPNDTWYLVSGKWWNSWKSYTEYGVRYQQFVLLTNLFLTSLASFMFTDQRKRINSKSHTIQFRQGSEDHSEESVLIGCWSSYLHWFIFIVENDKSKNHPGHAVKSLDNTKKLSSNPAPGPINNSDIIIEEQSKVRKWLMRWQSRCWRSLWSKDLILWSRYQH